MFWAVIKFELITRLRVVPQFPSRIVPDSRASETLAPAKIIPREKGETWQGERKMRDYRQSPSFWPFTATWFWSVKFVSPFKSIKCNKMDPSLSELSMLLLLVNIKCWQRLVHYGRANQSYALWEKRFKSKAWALSVCSLYYPWGKMRDYL